MLINDHLEREGGGGIRRDANELWEHTQERGQVLESNSSRVQVSKWRCGVSKGKRLTQSGGKSGWLPLCCKKATLFIFYNCTKDSMEMGERGLVNRD